MHLELAIGWDLLRRGGIHKWRGSEIGYSLDPSLYWIFITERYYDSVSAGLSPNGHSQALMKRTWYPLFAHALDFLTFQEFQIIPCHLHGWCSQVDICNRLVSLLFCVPYFHIPFYCWAYYIVRQLILMTAVRFWSSACMCIYIYNIYMYNIYILCVCVYVRTSVTLYKGTQ